MSIECTITAISSSFLSKANTGLGNVLFQVASTYGLAKSHGRIPSFYQLHQFIHKLKAQFGYNHMDTIFRKFSTFATIPSTISCKEQPANFALQDMNVIDFIETHPGNNICLEGYFQSHLYFNNYRNDILDLFSIDNPSLEQIKTKYPVLFDASHTCISLHFRTSWLHGIQYSPEYYREAIEYIKARVANPHFMIYADNVNTIRPFCSSLTVPFTIVEQNPDYIDLWTMSICKHAILSFSTFSWWGAYLNRNPDKIVVYPHDSMRIVYGLQPTPQLLDRMTQHYFPEWIPLYSKSIA